MAREWDRRTVDEAVQEVDRTLDGLVLSGGTFLRIIHGKGIGALRETVHKVLERRDDVVRFGLDSKSASGWGATLVELRRG